MLDDGVATYQMDDHFTHINDSEIGRGLLEFLRWQIGPEINNR